MNYLKIYFLFLGIGALLFPLNGKAQTTGTIQARVWDDQNGNGIQDNGESNRNIEGVSVHLLNASTGVDLPNSPKLTNSSGIAEFSDVPAGLNVKLKFILLDDHAFTSRNSGGDDNKDSDAKGDGTTDAFSLAAGTTVKKNDAGLWSPGEVKARVWDDQNGNGVQDNGESNKNIAGVLVKLLENDGVTQITDANNMPVEALTGGDGIATLSYVPANRLVKLHFDNLPDHARTGRNQGGNDDKDSDAKGDGTTDAFQANKGNQTHTKHDAGLWTPGEVLARVWDDQNGNGIQDNGESNKNISGVLVKLMENDGTTQVKDGGNNPVEATTNSSGIATLTYVPADRLVKLHFGNLPDHARTGRNKGGNDDKDSDAKGDGTTDAFQANKGNQTHTKHDAGLWTPGEVLARVWDDQNGNGVQDNGESNKNISGVLVKLMENDGKTQVKDESNNPVQATTNSNGIAVLSYVPADRLLKLEFGTLPDHARTGRNKGGNDDKDSDAKGDGTTDAFQANRGNQSHTKHDGGLWTPGKALARVWDDQNGNGVQDNGESNKNISGVLVKLMENNGTTQVQDNHGNAVQAVTNGNGIATLPYVPANRLVKFHFGNLPDHARTGRNKGGNDDKDSDAKGDGTTDAFQADRGNQTHTKHDAGLWTPGEVVARVWLDGNKNGIQDNGENKVNNNIFGMRVSLIETNGDPVKKNGQEVYAYTDCKTGLATLDYVPADRFVKLKFEKFSGASFSDRNKGGNDNKDSDAKGDGTTDAFKADRGSQTHTKHDAGLEERGNYGNATITALVWDDNADGIQQVSEKNNKGIANVKVSLLDNDGNECICERTNSSGQVSLKAIAGVPGFPSRYSLKFHLPKDHKFTDRDRGDDDTKDSDAIPSQDGKTPSFNLSPNQIKTDVDAGLWAPGTLETLVWNDNADGIQQVSERDNKGISGVIVKLLENDGSTELASTTTNNEGKASFNYVPADRNLKLRYILPADHKFTDRDEGGDDTKDSDAIPSQNGLTSSFSATKGSDNITHVDAGLWAPGTLETLVWDDNADGIQQVSERDNKGIAGVTVKLMENNGTTELASAVTNSDGKATFNYVPADRNLKLKYILPDDHKFTSRDEGNDDTKDSDAIPSQEGLTSSFQATKGGDQITHVDAGLWAPGTLETFVWDDNADGIQQVSERNSKGIEGVMVKLVENDGTTELASAVTNSDGKATFNYVPADRNLKLKYILPDDHKFTSRDEGNDDKDSDAIPSQDGLTPSFSAQQGSDHITHVDAGLWAPGTVEAFVWEDNGDGIQQVSEQNGKGIAGVTVLLLDNDGSTLGSQASNGSGKVSFSGVPADRQVKLQVVLPLGYTYAPRDQGNNDAKDSDAIPSQNGKTPSFGLTKGSDIVTHVDAGLIVQQSRLAADQDERAIMEGIFNISVYPNPANYSTNIKLDIQQKGFAHVAIFDTNGKLVSTLLKQKLESGIHALKWNTNNVSEGIYICKITLDGHINAQRIVVKR